VRPEDFRVVSGEADLVDCQLNTNSAHHLFCRHCGVRSFEWGNIPQTGDKYYTVNVLCLDNLDVDELMAAPVTYYNGRNNNWWHPPVEIRHF
jgi:hypothetical protein